MISRVESRAWVDEHTQHDAAKASPTNGFDDKLETKLSRVAE
jgi:hypothetical protein